MDNRQIFKPIEA